MDSHCNKIRMIRVSLLVVFFLAAAASGKQVERHPKLFFVSTSSTTSTLKTGTECYVSSGTLSTCPGRKRRAILVDGGCSVLQEVRLRQEGQVPALLDHHHLHLHLHLLHHHLHYQQCCVHTVRCQCLQIVDIFTSCNV